MIPEQTPYASEVNALAHHANFKPVNYYLIPPWLDDTLKALKLFEVVLADQKKLETILTLDDIKFYNENLAKVYERKSALPIPQDISLSCLSTPVDGNCISSILPPLVCSENSISLSEALRPFVKVDPAQESIRVYGLVARYVVNKLENSYLISIRLETCSPERAVAEQAKEDQMLAEFYIGEFGLQSFSNTELFKKVLLV